MSTWSEVVPEWRARLAHAGLTDPLHLLDKSPNEGGWAGHWEQLSKPGLGGRERWRWTLADGGQTVLYVKRYQRTP
jgi:hypothetical protein